MDKDIIEGNRIIAAFDGLKEYEDHEYGTSWSLDDKRLVRYPDHELPYHSDWNWLMPVVEKIEKLGDSGFDLNILWDGRPPHNHLCEIRHAYTYEGSWKKQIVLISKPTKIEAVWHAVVQFIKWYNTNSLTTKQD